MSQKHRVPGTPLQGNVSELARQLHASAQMAPRLHFIIRKVVEGRQVEASVIETYLEGCRSLERYDRAFKMLWALASQKGTDFSTCSILEVSALVLELSKVSLAQARNAYSGLLLIPGLDQLRFAPLLQGVKRLWGKSQPKYAGFWDASPILQK